MDGALWSEDDGSSDLNVESSSSGGGGDVMVLWETEGGRMHLLYSRRRRRSLSDSLTGGSKLLNYEAYEQNSTQTS